MGATEPNLQPAKPVICSETGHRHIIEYFRHASVPAGVAIPTLPTVFPSYTSPIRSIQLVQVVRRVVLAPDVVTLHLARPGTMQPPTLFLAGQYITLMLPGRDDVHYRSYSLSNASTPNDPWEITIKRRPQGVISSYLFAEIRESMVFQVMPPRGEFTLPSSLGNAATLIFIAAGSGITPVRSMVRAVAALPPGQRPQVNIHQMGQTIDDLLFASEWQTLDPAAQWLMAFRYLTANGEAPTAAALIARHGNGARHHWYISGPEAFVIACYHELVQQTIPPAHIHIERRG